MSDKPKSPRKRRTRHRYRKHAKAKSTARDQPAANGERPAVEEGSPSPSASPARQQSSLAGLPEEPPQRRVLQSKLDSSFVQEEREVRASLESRRTLDHGTAEQTQDGNQQPPLHPVDREILFFTDSLPEDVFYDAEEGPPNVAAIERKTKNSVHSPRSSKSSNEPDSPTHLTSSYFQPEDATVVVVPWKTQKLDRPDDSLLYYQPDRNFTVPRAMLKEVRVDSSASIVDDYQQEDEPEVASKKNAIRVPNVSAANMNRFMNRLVEEEHDEWFDASGELIGFQRYMASERVRGFCSKTFDPFFVEPIPLAKTLEQLPMERTVKILIGKLRFDEHPSFEPVVRMRLKLEQLYRQYYRTRRLNRVATLEVKLRELRANNGEDDGKERLDEYGFKMARRELRKLIYQEVRTERTLATQILELWEELKELDCGLKLTVVNRSSSQNDIDESRDALQERYTLELRETLEEEHELYLRDKQEYKAYLRDLELEEGGTGGADRRPSMIKPKKPDTARLRHEFRQLFDDTFGASDESPPTNILLQRVRVTEGSDGELARHRATPGKDLQFKAKLFIDGSHVASTKPRHFQDDVLVDFNTSFSIKLTNRIPKTVSVHLYEKNCFKVKTKRAELFIPVPSRGELYDESEYVDYQFTCGKPYKSQSYANGTIELKVGWLEQAGSSFPSPSRRRVVPRRIKLSSEQIQRWFEDHVLNNGEVLDPTQLQALSMAQSQSQSVAGRKSSDERRTASSPTDPHGSEGQGTEQDEEAPPVFRFNEDLLAFCSEETIERNERLQMLTMRFNRTLKYRDAKFIPQSERELAFTGYDGHEEQRKIIDETLGTDPIDLQRHRGKRYLQQVYDIISNHCRVLTQDKVNNNLLVGAERVLSFGALSLAFLDIFGPRRPLKPSRRSPTSRASIRVTDVTHFRLVVTIVRAFGIPMRTEDSQSMAADDGRRHSNMSSIGRFSFRTSSVRPYITVSIKDRVLRTSTAEGTAPTWNEQLELPLDIASDQIRKHLHIDLYDEYLENLLEDDRARPTEMYQRISSRWLGQLRIPISTVYLNQRLEGTFEIKTPPILFGYDRQQQQQQQQPSQQGFPTTELQESYGTAAMMAFIGSSGTTNLPDVRELTHVSLFISLEPPVERPSIDTSCLECAEVDQVSARVSLWFQEYRHEFPARAIVSPMVTLLGGKRVCATRLLGPLPVPFPIDEKSEMMIRRYVSLIPVPHTIDPCSQLSGIWLTNKEILTMMCASPKDLGVLLACFYLELGYDVWLIFGNSVLMGDGTFVLLLDGGEYFIVDPCSGRRYSSTDTYCPLSRIYLIVGTDNIWGNIQKENRVFLTQLDVRKSGYWRALFNRFNEPPTGCIQEVAFQFQEALPVRDLQRTIERKLMRKISAWRSHRKTVWNRYINEQLRGTLISLEQDTCLEADTDRYAAEEFGQMFVSYKINGFPINMPYTNLSSIVAQVKGTGIHLNSEADVEFALGVHLKPYPCNVYSVWVFLMSLVPRV
ncbi:coiled-coil and C2 domain-containing protein 2A-like [Anopheles albimanus]|uniref:C2 domain-containing protein n=1 Tax=Anopheles albimanus TaxID=7167 RepID=A0A182F1Q5_ANOAL|nr:coiled-coil and C2 domain-containing protein 2A-like [Anopheles albimanus]